MAAGRPRQGDSAARHRGPGPRRGLVMFSKPLPRFVITKCLASGSTAFYFHLSDKYRKLACPIPNEPLGTDYHADCGDNGEGGRAATLNKLFDERNAARRGEQLSTARINSFGTVDWLFREYKA